MRAGRYRRVGLDNEAIAHGDHDQAQATSRDRVAFVESRSDQATRLVPGGNRISRPVDARGRQHQHVDPPDSVGSQRLQHSRRGGTAPTAPLSDHDDCPSTLPPHDDSREGRSPYRRRRMGSDRGRDHCRRGDQQTQSDHAPACAGDRQDDADGHERHVHRPHHSERRGSCRSRHTFDPRQCQLGRPMEQRSDAPAGDPCRQPGDEPPGHHESRHWHREEVGGQGRDRHRTERGEQKGRHAELRCDGHRERLAQPRGAGKRSGDRSGEQQDGCRRRHRETESHRSHQQGVDQQKQGGSDRQQSDPRSRSTNGAGEDGQCRDRTRP
jgi:hypothetical protein